MGYNTNMIHNMSRVPSDRRDHIVSAIKLVTVVNVAVYFVAAILHLGAEIPLGVVTLGLPDEPILPATIVESLIGAGLAVAAIAMFMRSHHARLVWGAYVFALVGTLFGMTIALLRNLPAPEIWLHVVMLIGLAIGFALLSAGGSLRDNSAAGEVGGD
jgi:uncharacterized RDD family membrane protein YckC